jgi:hypothetical protein
MSLRRAGALGRSPLGPDLGHAGGILCGPGRPPAPPRLTPPALPQLAPYVPQLPADLAAYTIDPKAIRAGMAPRREPGAVIGSGGIDGYAASIAGSGGALRGKRWAFALDGDALVLEEADCVWGGAKGGPGPLSEQVGQLAVCSDWPLMCVALGRVAYLAQGSSCNLATRPNWQCAVPVSKLTGCDPRLTPLQVYPDCSFDRIPLSLRALADAGEREVTFEAGTVLP